MTDLHETARRALDSLDDLIANTTDPGVEALGARHELATALIDAPVAVRSAPADRPAFIPPAAEGLPPGALDSAADGASALDAWARTPHGRNFLAHALVQLARDGWLRAEAADGFEPVRDRETPETRQSCACGQDGCEYCDVDDEPQDDGDVFELPGPEVVAYRNSDRPGVLLCRDHGDGWWGLTPLTSDDLPDGGLCTYGDPADPGDVCGRDVLIPQPGKEA